MSNLFEVGWQTTTLTLANSIQMSTQTSEAEAGRAGVEGSPPGVSGFGGEGNWG